MRICHLSREVRQQNGGYKKEYQGSRHLKPSQPKGEGTCEDCSLQGIQGDPVQYKCRTCYDPGKDQPQQDPYVVGGHTLQYKEKDEYKPKAVVNDSKHCFDPIFYLVRSEEHTFELQSRGHLVCRLLLEK